MIDSSDPDSVNVTESLASPSVAVTVPILVWFSAALKVADDVKTGELSFRLVTLTVIDCVIEFVPSVAVTVAV